MYMWYLCTCTCITHALKHYSTDFNTATCTRTPHLPRDIVKQYGVIYKNCYVQWNMAIQNGHPYGLKISGCTHGTYYKEVYNAWGLGIWSLNCM